MSYRIVTDTCCDLWQEFYKELDLEVVPLTVRFQQQDVEQYPEAWLKDFYNGLRQGETGTTNAVNPQSWKDVIAPVLQQGHDALVLVFSSGLSATYQSAVIAQQELSEEYPQRTVRVVDTLCASMGQGLLVWYACQKRNAGWTLEEVAQWCEDHKLNLCHWFTVNDLMFLKRGGRVSATTALVGSMLQIKPVMHMDDQGKLQKVSTVRGRKNAIDALAKKLAETGLPGENETVFISHGDCPEDAAYLAQLVKDTCGVKQVITYYIGAVIGSHSGPDTLALFFLGNQR